MMERLFKKKELIPKYGLIRRGDDNCGLGSYFITIVGAIRYCLNKGMIPIVDMRHGNNVYKQDKKENSWEYYFKQPFDISVDEALDSKQYEVIESSSIISRPDLSMDFFTNETAIMFWRDFVKSYISVSDSVSEMVEKYQDELIGDSKEYESMVGVLARGTDYFTRKPKGHPVQPAIGEIIQEINKMMIENNCSRIYLATEDKEIFEKLRTEFGNQITAPNEDRYLNDGDSFLSEQIRKGDGKRSGLEYLSSIIILSRCKYLVAGRTSGTVMAYLLGDGYKDVKLFNNGCYGIDDIETLKVNH